MPNIELLSQLEVNPYADPSLRNVIEDHIVIIREQRSKIVSVSAVLADRYHGNFYGLLSALVPNGVNLNPTQYWVVLRCNDLCSPLDYKRDMLNILIPDMTFVNEIMNTHRMVRYG